MNQCVRNHIQWQQFACSESSGPYIIGKRCYEVQNDCLSECEGIANDPPLELFVLHENQRINQWRQTWACSPETQIFPFLLLPGDQLIDPQWRGQCECRNGLLLLAECGHQKITCDQACDQGVPF